MLDLNFDELKNKSSAELFNVLDEIEKEQSVAIRDHFVVEQAYEELALKILKLQAEKKTLKINLDKALHVIRQYNNAHSRVKSLAWQVKNSGL